MLRIFKEDTARKQPYGISVVLQFSKHDEHINACVVDREALILCDDKDFIMRAWLATHPQEVLDIIRETIPEIKRLKIFVNSHRV